MNNEYEPTNYEQCPNCGEILNDLIKERFIAFLIEERIKAPISVEWYIIKLIDGLREKKK